MAPATGSTSHPLTVLPPETARQRLTQQVKRLAHEHGLSVSAITTAEAFPELRETLLDRLAAGHLAGLDWFTPERASASCAPVTLMPNPLAIISVGIAYWGLDAGKPDDGVPRGRISRYARGLDYHLLLSSRMRALHDAVTSLLGERVDGRCLTDHARIIDRAVAARAGLGWYGKNACIIVPGHGSWVMLGELLLELDLEPDAPLARDCGRCTNCLAACPTGAIVAPYTIHVPSCLSYQTIEQRGAIPRDLRSALGDWVFGCDVCQEVCPYTGAAVPEPDPAFLPRSVENAYPDLRRLLTMSRLHFRDVYRGTAVLRARREGLARNAAVVLGNIGTDEDVPHLGHTLLSHDAALVRGHAAWALGQIGGGEARRTLHSAWQRERDAAARQEIELALANAA